MAARRLAPPLLGEALLLFLISRALLALVVLLATELVPPAGAALHRSALPAPLKILVTSDAVEYVVIARDGYAQFPGEHSILAFPPLLPLLMRLGGLLAGRYDDGTLLLSGAIAANLALLIGLAVLGALLRLDADRPATGRALFYLLLFPTSFFFSLASADSLYFLFTVSAFYAARQRYWLLAGLLGGVAGLARAEGVVLLLPLVVEYLAQLQFNLKAVRLDLLGLVLVPLFLLAYIAWSAGDALAGLRVLQAFRPDPTSIGSAIQRLTRLSVAPLQSLDSLLELTCTAGFVVLLLSAWGRLRASYALFATLALVACLPARPVAALARCVLPVFPAFVILARLGQRPWFDRLYLMFAAGLSGLAVVLAARGYWPQ